MFIGSAASDKAFDDITKAIKKQPRNYMAQPIISLSTAPTVIDQDLEPRHVDLRPFILQGQSRTSQPAA